jgi:hypothetical protein
VALVNKRHFEEKNGECAACLKYSVLIFVVVNKYDEIFSNVNIALKMAYGHKPKKDK